MTERLTPSDLVYLFVDGEATGAERTEMYAALATDNELQTEFEDALRLKQTVDDEIAAAVPPMETTKELLMRAGFTLPLPIAGNEAIAPAVSHIADSGFLTALKSFVAPLLVTTGIITTGIITMPLINKIGAENVAQNTTQVSQVFPSEQTTNAPLVEMASADAPAARSSVESSPVKTEVIRSYRSAASTNTMRSYHAVETTPAEQLAIIPAADTTQATTDAVLATLVQVEPKAESQTQIMIGEPAERVRQLADLRRDDPVTGPKDLWFTARGIAGLSLFPSRMTDGAQSVRFNNVAFSAEYQISPMMRVGLAAGTETFPHYTVNADTSLTEKWNIVWAGASYAISVPQLAIGPIIPSATVLLGGAATGPIMKVGTGLTWQPDDRVSFTAGLETTGLLYHYGSNYRMGGKLGATYSVAVRF